MPDVAALATAAQRVLLNNYRQAPLAMSRGQGSELWDTEGRRYLDMTAGGALSVTGQGKYREGFGPLFGPVKFLPFGDLEAVRRTVGAETCAVIIEPVQAEGGIHLPPPGFLQELRRHCTDTGTVLIFDEVQTGV